MNKRIDYLDGLKGISAILVSFYHFMILGFIDGFVGFGTHYTEAEALTTIKDNLFSAFLTNNSVGLYIFFVLIAIFPIMSFRKKNNDPLIMGRYAAKRYFQLMPLCFITSMFMVILYDLNLLSFDKIADLTNNAWMITCNPDHSNILLALKANLFDCWFINTRDVASLWCMFIIFKGSLAVYASYALFSNSKFKYLPTIILFILSCVNINYIYFAFGSIIGEILASDKNKKLPIFVSILFILVGIFIIKIPNNLYPFTLSSSITGALGAFIIIYGVIKSELLQKGLSCKVFKFLGSISFELIISHVIVLGTITYPIVKLLLNYMELGFAFSLVIGTIVTLISIPLAYLLKRFVTPLGRKLGSFIEKLLFKEIKINTFK